jgi:hypothetical protein
MVLVKATEDSEKGEYAGHEEEFAAMGRYNEELLRAGIMGRMSSRRRWPRATHGHSPRTPTGFASLPSTASLRRSRRRR